jgi:hypothetical protein
MECQAQVLIRHKLKMSPGGKSPEPPGSVLREVEVTGKIGSEQGALRALSGAGTSFDLRERTIHWLDVHSKGMFEDHCSTEHPGGHQAPTIGVEAA